VLADIDGDRRLDVDPEPLFCVHSHAAAPFDGSVRSAHH